MNKKKTGTIIFIAIILITIICTTFTLVKINSLKADTKTTEQQVNLPKQKNSKDFIAALHITGVIQEENQTSGHYEEYFEKCIECNGQGFILKKTYMGGGEISDVKRRCAFCHGTGQIRKSKYVID